MSSLIVIIIVAMLLLCAVRYMLKRRKKGDCGTCPYSVDCTNKELRGGKESRTTRCRSNIE